MNDRAGRGEPALHRCTLASGDVALSYHVFGAPSANAPILIMHGSNYYDSEDWLGVAAALAADREVATFDHRGLRSSRFPPDTVKMLEANYPGIAWATVDSQHDMAAQAPRELVAATRKFIEQA